jgi:chorismate dehydratase
VSFLNTRPLVEGLDDLPQLELFRAVPSELREMLWTRQVEAALLPAIDLQRFGAELTVLPAGCVACSGTAMSVRVFSHVRPHRIEVLWTDSDSHCSVALAQVIWHFQFKRKIRVIPFTAGKWDVAEDAQAVLMIGDKVVSEPPIGFDFQFDLGRLWYEMTGLPFVFAVWAASDSADLGELWRVLSAARRDGQENLEEIARTCGPRYGWPADMAHRYLTQCMDYEFTDAHREGMEEFFDLAAEIGIIDPPEPLRYYQP